MTLSRKLQVLFLSLGKFITTLSAIVSSIALSRLLSIDEYANYRQTILVYAFITPLLSLGFDKAMFFNFEKNKENQQQQIINIQYVILSLAIIIAVFFIAGGNGLVSRLFNNSFIEKGVLIYSIFSIFNLPLLLLQPLLVIKQKVKLLTTFNIANKALSVVITVIVAYFYRDANSVLISLLFVGILTFISVQIIILKNTTGNRNFNIDKKIINDYKVIGIPLVLASIMGVAAKNIDKLLISTMMTPSDFAIYSNGALEIPLIGAITGAVMVVILSDFTKLLDKGKIEETFILWGKAVGATSSILIPLMYLLLLNADWLIITMYGEKYRNSAIPFSIYLLLIPIRTMTFSSIMTASGNTKLIMKGALYSTLFNIIFSTLLIYKIGFIGPAIATVVSTYLLAIFYSYQISRDFKISIFDVFAIRQMRNYFLIGLISSLFSVVALYLIEYFSVLKIVISNVIFVIVYIIGVIVSGKSRNYIYLFDIIKKSH